MKKTNKAKSAPVDPKFNQLEFLEKLAQTQSDIYTLLLRTVERLDKLEAERTAGTARPNPAWKDAPYEFEFFHAQKPIHVGPAPLKWTELGTYSIKWCVSIDPREFSTMKPGDKLEISPFGVIHWNGKTLGTTCSKSIIDVIASRNQGHKIHAFFRSTGEVTIKVGRPQ